jgi:L-threonylcarbamoyladenylate synthase
VVIENPGKFKVQSQLAAIFFNWLDTRVPGFILLAMEVLSTDTPALFTAAIRRAVELLTAGEVVSLPTETVYGLAANAFDSHAVSRIFEIKGRPKHNPIIVHVAGIEMARSCVAQWPAVAHQLARAFWPGPLTLVLPRSEAIPKVVTAGGPTVGVRWPSHPFMQAVISACRFPLAAPSANLANKVSPTTAAHVVKQLGKCIPLVVDGGPSHVGIESTVLDISADPPRLLRPGMVHKETLAAVIGPVSVGSGPKAELLKSPGLLPKHYAPRAKLALWSWKNEGELKQQTLNSGIAGAKIHVIAHTHIPSDAGLGRVSVIPHDAEAFARAIYAELHACDDAGAELIVVEALPSTHEWRAIVDRLNRAAG